MTAINHLFIIFLILSIAAAIKYFEKYDIDFFLNLLPQTNKSIFLNSLSLFLLWISLWYLNILGSKNGVEFSAVVVPLLVIVGIMIIGVLNSKYINNLSFDNVLFTSFVIIMVISVVIYSTVLIISLCLLSILAVLHLEVIRHFTTIVLSLVAISISVFSLVKSKS